MGSYIIRRLLLMVPILFIISIIAFMVMDLPPGDFASSYVTAMMEQGENVKEAEVERLREMWGLDKPMYVRYFRWVVGLMKGELGYSLYWRAPVKEIIISRFMLSMIISFSATLFAWLVAFPIGIYSAIHQYSLPDFFWTFIGFIGLSIPNFLLALVLMYLGNKYFDISIGGLFSIKYVNAVWSWGKFIDFLSHFWVPIIVIGTAGTAGLIRIVRANLIDELSKPYVEMARSKGIKESKLIIKYPVRIAINPFISSIGWVLPGMVSGSTIVSVVLGLPTAGPIFLQALKQQDMQIAGAYIMLISAFTVAGIFLSDILLAVVDPRIRYT